MFGSLIETIKRVLGRQPATSAPVEVKPTRRTHLDDVQRVCDRYPTVTSIAFNLSMRSPDNDVEPTLNGRSFGPNARALFKFKCKNVDCVDGGFDLQAVVDEMVQQDKPETAGRRVCQGWESAALVNQRRCLYELNFKIVAVRNSQA